MFNDTYGLTRAVLDGQKTMTRRLVMQPPYDEYDLELPVPFPAFEESNPLWGTFRWVNKHNDCEHTDWIPPKWRLGEEVAIAQSYKDAGFKDTDIVYMDEYLNETNAGSVPGWSNKMFVRADLMPHRIRITDIKLQSLHDISEDDCLKEGVIEERNMIGGTEIKKYHPTLQHVKSMKKIGWGIVYDTPKDAFAVLIDKVSGEGTWKKNPWVFVYEFELIK